MNIDVSGRSPPPPSRSHARKELYSAATHFTLVDVPQMQYLAVDGHGDPNTAPAYIEALYSVAYTLKFASKKTLGRDFVVGPLEGLWRAGDMAAFAGRDKDAWDWTMMIVQPGWITKAMIAAATSAAGAKKTLSGLARLALRTLEEGTAVQILHVGPYDDEGPTLDRLHHEYLPAAALTFNGDHHEIYLSDPRRAAPTRRGSRRSCGSRSGRSRIRSEPLPPAHRGWSRASGARLVHGRWLRDGREEVTVSIEEDRGSG